MTYEEFKIRLCISLMRLEGGEETDIGILNGRDYSADGPEGEVVRMINFLEYRRESRELREDYLYYLRDGCMENLLYWSVRECYEKYRSEGWQGILPEILADLSGGYPEGAGSSGAQYFTIRTELIVRPINALLRERELYDAVYWRFGDVALVLYALCFDDLQEMITRKISMEDILRWGKKKDVILSGALLNSFYRMPPRIYYSQDLERYYDGNWGAFMPGDPGVPIRIDGNDWQQGNVGYRLTTSRRTNGAIAIFYPGVKERLAELLGGDYYVGFLDTDSVILHPVRFKKLSEMASAICRNGAVCDPGRTLTRKIYRYVTRRKELLEV